MNSAFTVPTLTTKVSLTKYPSLALSEIDDVKDIS